MKVPIEDRGKDRRKRRPDAGKAGAEEAAASENVAASGEVAADSTTWPEAAAAEGAVGMAGGTGASDAAGGGVAGGGDGAADETSTAGPSSAGAGTAGAAGVTSDAGVGASGASSVGAGAAATGPTVAPGTGVAVDATGDGEWDEAAMVEAARRAGEEAAEADLRAAAARTAADEAQASADAARAAAEGEGVWTAANDARVAADVAVRADAALRAELDAARAEASEATARLARLQADWENFRRRTAAERVAERERAAERLVTALLPVLDDMERASAHAAGTDEAAEPDSAFAQFVAGVDAVHDKMVGVLAREGVEVIDPAGQAFDPLEHQAVGRVEDASVLADTVAEVYQRGYRMGGKVIRAAMVTVTFGGPARPAEGAGDDGEAAAGA